MKGKATSLEGKKGRVLFSYQKEERGDGKRGFNRRGCF